MKNNKKLLLAGLSIAGVAAIGASAFAFLSAESEKTLTAKTGTVSMAATVNMEHSYSGTQGDAISNVNPGDNDPTVPDGSRDGNDHEISVDVNNTGNKSITTRNVIKIQVLDGITPLDHHIALADGKVSSAVLLYYDATNKEAVGNSKDHTVPGAPASGADWTTADWIDSVSWDEDSKTLLVYTKPIVLNGTGDNVETETGVTEISKSYTYDLGLSKNVGQYTDDNKETPYASNADALNSLYGKTISVTVDVQAMQYRNTSDSDWQTIFTETNNA